MNKRIVTPLPLVLLATAAAVAFPQAAVAEAKSAGIALPPEAGGGVPVGCCQAKPGYDWASGWGSLKLPGFAEAAARAAR